MKELQKHKDFELQRHAIKIADEREARRLKVPKLCPKMSVKMRPKMRLKMRLMLRLMLRPKMRLKMRLMLRLMLRLLHAQQLMGSCGSCTWCCYSI